MASAHRSISSKILAVKLATTLVAVLLAIAAMLAYDLGLYHRGWINDLQTQAEAYARLFAIFARHKDTIDRVTFWGLSDRRTWRFGQNPLIFDANNQRKPAYVAIVDAMLHPNPHLATPPQ